MWSAIRPSIASSEFRTEAVRTTNRRTASASVRTPASAATKASPRRSARGRTLRCAGGLPGEGWPVVSWDPTRTGSGGLAKLAAQAGDDARRIAVARLGGQLDAEVAEAGIDPEAP